LYKIEITKPAEKDLLDAALYIKEQLLNPAAANRLLDEAEKVILSLGSMPERQALVNDEVLARSGLRSVPVLNYTIFYAVREERSTIVIHRILYSRRDWASLMKSE